MKCPTNRRPTDRCVPKDHPRPVRDDHRCHLKQVKSHAQCVDDDGQRCEYGQFDDVLDLSECANACVKMYDPNSSTCVASEVSTLMAVSTSAAACVIKVLWTVTAAKDLTDPTAISMDMAQSMDRSTYCGKLVGAKFMEANEILEADITELWDTNDVD